MIHTLQGAIPRLGWALAVGVGVLVIGAAVSLDSTAIALALVMALAGAAVLTWLGRPKRLMIGLLFFVAPVDISKALVPPLTQFYSPGLYLSLGHALVLALVGWWLAQRLLIERRLPPFGRMDASVLLFLTLIWAGAFRSAQGGLAIASAISYTLAVLGFYVASHAINDPAEWRVALWASMAVVGLQLVYVLLQFLAKSPLPLPGSKVQSLGGVLRFGGEGLAFRPSGFLEHPNALADHMTLIIPTTVALLLLGRERLPRWVWWGALATLAAATAQLLLTLSRGGWISTALGVGLVVVVYWKRGLIRSRHVGAGVVVALVVAASAVAVYPSILLRLTAPDDRATESRFILNNQALAIIQTAPLGGVGYGGYNRAAYETVAPAFALISPEYQQSLLKLVVHNHYLLLAAELGVPTAVFFVLLLLAFMRLPWSVRAWSDPALYALAIGLAGSVLAQMFFLNSDNYYADIRIFMLWLALGALRGVCRCARRETS